MCTYVLCMHKEINEKMNTYVFIGVVTGSGIPHDLYSLYQVFIYC